MADKRRLQERLHQQMWRWGRDVARTASPGSLLIWAGMARHGLNAPDERGSNRYSIVLAGSGVTIFIRAFGLVATDASGGAFLHRYQRGVRRPPSGWQPDGVRAAEAMPPTRRPDTQSERERASRLLDVMVRWIESYERGVIALLGPEHRTRMLARWGHPAVEGPAMADEWRRLAGVYQRAQTARTTPLGRLGGINAGGRTRFPLTSSLAEARP